ncbi:MAG: serine hydrolase domain-containing protein [Pseudomonadota bacterium]
MVSEDIKAAVAAGKLSGLHGVIATHRGEVIAEAYFPGEDEHWGFPLGSREHGPDTLHDVRSISKSVVSLLYGIALARGEVPPIDEPLYAQFPEYTDLGKGPGRDAIRIEHALTMSMGTQWDETIPYTDPKNSERAMEAADDRYRFILEQPIVTEPGTTFTYSGGATALIGRIIADGTGEDIDAFAKDALFDPLGISQFEWTRGDDNVPAAASGLRLTLPDMAKIGSLIVDDGRHGDTEVVPKAWLDASFTRRIDEPTGLGYGLSWYLSHPALLSRWVAAFGLGGQRLLVHPDDGVVLAVHAGGYTNPDAWQIGMGLAGWFVYPAVRERMRGGIR